MSATKASLRDSASLIIAAMDHGRNPEYDYSVLLFKRSDSTALFRDHCVFPGGVCELADEGTKWLLYFEELDINQQQLENLIIRGSGRPDIFKNTDGCCPRDISLRITAIRETFEEVGLLLCREKQDIGNNKIYGHKLNDCEIKYWQNRVHSNPNEFLNLCKSLSIVPDVWSLQEWSVWRSSIKASKRFDTVFYFVALEEIPKLLTEKTEVADYMWLSPTMFLKAYSNQKIWLPPIQFYEISRLTHINSYDDLKSYSKRRSKKGSTLLMPVYYKCTDGMVGTLFGDEMYPLYPEVCDKTVTIKSSVEDFRSQVKYRHRFVYRDMYDLSMDLTIRPIDDHLNPVAVNVDSKL